MLLYLVTKNHSFSDGNKRIAATLFLWFLNGNSILYNEDGTKRIADNTLVALTLMIAESRTEEDCKPYQPEQQIGRMKSVQQIYVVQFFRNMPSLQPE